MVKVEISENQLLLSSDKTRIDIQFVHGYLSRSYWSEEIPMETVWKAMENSLALGLFENRTQIGYCRVITDYSTFAYLADVFIIEEARG